MSSIFTPENTQALLQVIGSVVGLLLSALLVTIRQRTGVQIRVDQEIEIDRLRERFAEAIYNGTLAVLSKKPDASRDDQIDTIIGYLHTGISDTMEKLGVSDDILRMRATASLDEMLRYRKPKSEVVSDGQTAASG